MNLTEWSEKLQDRLEVTRETMALREKAVRLTIIADEVKEYATREVPRVQGGRCC